MRCAIRARGADEYGGHGRLAAAGIRPIGLHQIRHLLASSLLDGGYGIHEVAERLGHDPGTPKRYYARVSAQRRRQATDHIAPP